MSKRVNFFANKTHKHSFMLVVAAAVLPTLIITLSLYFLIFGVITREGSAPHSISSTAVQVSKHTGIILISALPFIMGALLFVAYRVAHMILGPIDRISKEVQDRHKGHKTDPIKLRSDDKLHDLVRKINNLFEKASKH